MYLADDFASILENILRASLWPNKFFLALDTNGTYGSGLAAESRWRRGFCMLCGLRYPVRGRYKLRKKYRMG